MKHLDGIRGCDVYQELCLKTLVHEKFHYESSEIELSGRPLPKFIKVMISVIKTKLSEL
jgi:hypothetical protein